MGEAVKQYCCDAITPSNLQPAWELLQRVNFFSAGMRFDRFFDLLHDGVMQLWVEPDLDEPTAALVTEIADTGLKRCVNILAFAGVNPDSKDDGERFKLICRWAFANGCSEISTVVEDDARLRLFGRQGFVKKGHFIALELKNEVEFVQ